MSPHVEFQYVAIKPLRCGLPDGSIVEYQPGDYIPEDVLGQSIGHLVLADKVARLAINVDDPEDEAASAPVVGEPDEDEADDASESEGFPKHQGGGIYLLSDGSLVRGKARAIVGEQELAVE